MTSSASSTGSAPTARKATAAGLGLPLVLVLALLLCAAPARAQSKKQLEKDKAKVEQEIKNLNSQLAKAKKNSKSGQQQISLLEKKISERTKLINNLNGQVSILGEQMDITQDSINLIRLQVDSMKQEYARIVRALYAERHNLDRLALVFDTRSYNYAYLRTKYFRDYSRYRRRQAALIGQKEQELHDANLDLMRQQREKSNLVAEQQRHKEALAREQQERRKALKDSQQREKSLQAQIADKEKQKRQLQQQIQKIINEEIAKANKAKQEAAARERAAKAKQGKAGSTGSTAGGGSGANKPAANVDVVLSNDFASNRGRLSWPCFYTRVAREYGKYTHESGGQNMNNGIDLVCKSGTTVQCIFEGTVSRVFTCPNGTKGVIVRHGEYLTVYANLGTVNVAEGAKVKTKQLLGTVYTNSDGLAEFSFQLWKGTTSQNPRSWLR